MAFLSWNNLQTSTISKLILLIIEKFYQLYTVLSPKAITYDAYEKDIAILQIYFKSPTIMEYGTFPSNTWIDFFSSIGGLLGLCIGISIVTFIEIFWLILRMAAKVVQPNRRKWLRFFNFSLLLYQIIFYWTKRYSCHVWCKVLINWTFKESCILH